MTLRQRAKWRLTRLTIVVVVAAAGCMPGAATSSSPPTSPPVPSSSSAAASASTPAASVTDWPTVAEARASLVAAGYTPIQDVTDQGEPRSRVRGIEILGPDGDAAEISIEMKIEDRSTKDVELVLAMLPAGARDTVLDTITSTLTEMLTATDQVDREADLPGGRVEMSAFPDDGTVFIFFHPA